ncbi:hypothetical protein, partial [Parabacteroides sp.]
GDKEMKATMYINSKGIAKGAFVYNVKKDGSKYAKPTFYNFLGEEKTAEDIIKRLEKLNPNKKFEKA